MTAQSPMKPLGSFLGLKWYWAERRWFMHPGVHVWTGKRHLRVFPLPRKWKARKEPQA